MSSWFHEHFAPGDLFLWIGVSAIILLPLIWVRSRMRSCSSLRFSSIHTLRRLPASLATRTRFVVPLLRTLAILALVLALLRPQSGGEYRTDQEGIAIQMVLDVSGSMATADFILDRQQVRRLDAVKKVFEDFVLGNKGLRSREGDLIGLTKFAMFADAACPLTLDHGSLCDLARETEIPGWVNGQEVRRNNEAAFTALGDAIALATDDLRRVGEQAIAGVPGAEAAKSKVMILLTDGKNNPADIAGTTPPDPIEAAKVAATLGIKIYTIGAIGNAPQPQRLGLFLPPGGDFDEPTLKQIAQITGGKYFRATDVDSLVTIYEEIDKLERRRTGERSFQDNIVAARMAMMVALGMLISEITLVCTRFRRIP